MSEPSDAKRNELKHAITPEQVAEKNEMDRIQVPDPEQPSETKTKTRGEVHPHTTKEVLEDNVKKGTIDPERLKDA